MVKRGARMWIGSFAAGCLVLSVAIVVAAEPAGATVSVGSEAALRVAFADTEETQIDLTANITLVDCESGAVTRSGADSGLVLVLDGHGHTITQTCGSRVLDIEDDFSGVTLQNVTITGGNSSTSGGGVTYHGSPGLTVSNAHIVDNQAVGNGGGLEADQLTITSSIITGNGPGIFTVESTGGVLISDSTISDNTSGGVEGLGGITVTHSVIARNASTQASGGLLSGDSNISVTNSTISNNTGNTAAISGATADLFYATVTDNTLSSNQDLVRAVTFGTASNVNVGSLTSFGSVVALPGPGGQNCSTDPEGGSSSGGYNFEDGTSCPFDDPTDKTDAGDPALGQLANNGGTTQTRKPGSQSPLRNAIPQDSCNGQPPPTLQTNAPTEGLDDQVGHARPQGSACDIGALEVPISSGGGTPPPGACDNAPMAPYTDRGSFSVHAHEIDCITAYGLAHGFDDGSFGATMPVTRAQMASFIARLLAACGVTLPSEPPDAFPGDNGDVHELAINQLAAVGVLDDTTGQSPPDYNVSAPLQRDDMAQLMFNAYRVIIGSPLAAGPNAFTDDDSSDNHAAIDALAAVNVVEGTGGGLYDPSGPVTRGQFAAFFARFVQLMVDAGKLPPLP